MIRAAFLDRDGVINRKRPEGEYVTHWEEMHLLPGVAEAIALLNRAGFRVIVVSNQRCIAKGLVTAAEVDAMHNQMCNELAHNGATIDRVYYCPHELNSSCNCRKPRPGMLLEAARIDHIDLAASWMIGDSEIDVEAGKKAGCKTSRLLENDEILENNPDVVTPSLLEAIRQILQREEVLGNRPTMSQNGMT